MTIYGTQLIVPALPHPQCVSYRIIQYDIIQPLKEKNILQLNGRNLIPWPGCGTDPFDYNGLEDRITIKYESKRRL